MSYYLKFFVIISSLFCTMAQATQEEDPLPASVAVINTPSFQVPYRIVTGGDPYGFAIELDDGSHWRIVNANDARRVACWLENDRVVIFPTLLPYWTGARFYILNERLSDAVYAELSLGPIAGLPSTNEISIIYPEAGLCQLMDGIGRTSQWAIHPDDMASFLFWYPGQAVIIGALTGSYSSWFTLYNPGYILINVEKNAYVRAALQ